MKIYQKCIVFFAMFSLIAVMLTGCGGGNSDGGGGTNSAPASNAGPDQNISTGSLVTLSGSGSSDTNGDVLTYSWSFTSKPGTSAAALTGATTVNPSFTADKDGTYIVQLIVNDGSINSSSDTVTITATTVPPPNSAPVANAGPDQNVLAGSQVVLDGTGSSDANSQTLTYSWAFTSQPTGSLATLSSSTASKPTFTADQAGSYVLTLIVNDGQADSTTDSVTIMASHPTPVPDTGQIASYTTTTGEDSDYTQNPPSYADNGDETITDNVTGLVWQKQNDTTIRGWGIAYTFCTNPSLTGSGWRLPSVNELMSIVDYGLSSSAVNTTYFPATQSYDYWSSTTDAGATGAAWTVSFTDGMLTTSSMAQQYYVRCVRGAGSVAVFIDNGDGTVTDAVTNLTWQAQDDATTKTWESALTYCEGSSLGGHNDWRLPNVKELRSIVDPKKYNLSINTAFFPNTRSSSYWTSTTYKNGITAAWSVRFLDGYVLTDTKTTGRYVRCVR